ncbi:hypothetical protein HPB52_013202 [Rhipicephalus sanguineus]|uniref:Elongation of very long chain fatty acids protein n=1 Tax=Rhipicephalus sanguineus TaxID=34632 RepID=A0A9D4Q6R8_RHISA|nr:hypothetical protein HPB52_013202 [Rhipicephalus sanguineus]
MDDVNDVEHVEGVKPEIAEPTPVYAERVNNGKYKDEEEDRDYVSGLHVVHHCVIAWNMWICVTYGAQAQTIFVTCMNTLVHLVMYSYYFLAALGPRAQRFLWWKRYLTQDDIGSPI